MLCHVIRITLVTFCASHFNSDIPDMYLHYRHSLSVTPETIICPSLLGSLLGSSALSVCPAIKAYISVTICWILMKLGESVGT